jgi:hypothetical protein
MTYIYPRYFDKPTGGKVNHPSRRPNPIIIDKEIPGGMADITARKAFDNGDVTLYLRNRNGPFVKTYTEAEVVPVNISQVMADTEAPLFITRDTKYTRSEFDKDIREAMEAKQQAIKDRDYWKKEHASIKANMQNEIDTQVKRAVELQKGNKPDWNSQGGQR